MKSKTYITRESNAEPLLSFEICRIKWAKPLNISCFSKIIENAVSDARLYKLGNNVCDV